MIERLLALLIAASLCSCATPRAPAEGPRPRAIELQEPQKIATMHFRPGVYFLDSSDHTGHYYRAPEGVIEHSFGGSIQRAGGIFLAAQTGKMRGYVSWAGERRKIGSITDVAFVE